MAAIECPECKSAVVNPDEHTPDLCAAYKQIRGLNAQLVLSRATAKLPPPCWWCGRLVLAGGPCCDRHSEKPRETVEALEKALRLLRSHHNQFASECPAGAEAHIDVCVIVMQALGEPERLSCDACNAVRQALGNAARRCELHKSTRIPGGPPSPAEWESITAWAALCPKEEPENEG